MGLWGMSGRHKVTAEEVRALPIGSRVRIHSRDRYGYPQELDCVVVATDRGKGLRYSDLFGPQTLSIRKLDGITNYYSVPEV